MITSEKSGVFIFYNEIKLKVVFIVAKILIKLSIYVWLKKNINSLKNLKEYTIICRI